MHAPSGLTVVHSSERSSRDNSTLLDGGLIIWFC